MTQAVERRLQTATRIDTSAVTTRARRAWVGSLARHALLIIVAALLLLPFYWMVVSALKSNSAIFARSSGGRIRSSGKTSVTRSARATSPISACLATACSTPAG
jgi:ABC-type glycerol-3-phosphate transport system permease component